MKTVSWNPWHGCHKLSEGCLNCYIYRSDTKRGVDTSLVHKTLKFNEPIARLKNRTFKIKSNTMIYTCFTSDFLVEEADEWRQEAWQMIKMRNDCFFLFLTKRIARFQMVKPSDWGKQYSHVGIGVSCENQKRVDERCRELKQVDFAYKSIVLAPLIEDVDISTYLSDVNEVVVEGENAYSARPLDYAWVLHVREQCLAAKVNFTFRGIGAHFIKDGKVYKIAKRLRYVQARKANIDLRFDDNLK